MRNQHEEQKRREKLKALCSRKCELVQLFRISCKIDKKRAGYFPVAKENICIYRLKKMQVKVKILVQRKIKKARDWEKFQGGKRTKKERTLTHI